MSVVLKHAYVASRQIALQLPHPRGLNNRNLDPELVSELGLPLVAEVRRAQDGQAPDSASVQQFPRDHGRLDRLADADVIGYEEPDRGVSESEEKRDELVRPRLHRDPAKGAEWPGSGAKGESSGVSQKQSTCEVAGVLRAGECIRRGLEGAAAFQGEIQPDRGSVALVDRPQAYDIPLFGRQDHPVSATRLNECANGKSYSTSLRHLGELYVADARPCRPSGLSPRPSTNCPPPSGKW